MRLLVTGGAGFIGSNFIHLALRERADWEVINLDALTYAGNLANLREVETEPRYTFILGDITDADLLDKIFADHRFDAIVNFAAESHVDRSILDSSAFLKTNVVGTQLLLDRARSAEVPRFLHISTDEVYGSLGNEGAFKEEFSLQPNSPYSASKAAADLLCRACGETHGYQPIITRSSNNFGPYQFPEKLIPLMISNALADKQLPVYGDGSNVRDWIYVEDNCRGLLAALEKGEPGRIYNIGGGNELPNIELVKRLLKILGKPESLITFVKDRPGHDKRYALDCSRAHAELGWQPAMSFDDALRRTVKWYMDNRGWVEDILRGDYQDYYRRNYDGR